MDQWNQIKAPEVNPHPHGHLIFDQEAKIIQWGEKKKASSVNGAGLTGCRHGEECRSVLIYPQAQNSSSSGSKTST